MGSRCKRAAGIALGVAIGLSACGAPRVPVPPEMTLAEPRAIEVRHPPPAALPEIVPEPPQPDAVWLDGHWTWQGSSWLWRRGGWLVVPPGVYLVKNRVWYDETGVLFFSDAQWVDARGREVPAPDILRPAGSPPTPVVAEEATSP